MKALFCIHGILSTHHDFDKIIENISCSYDYIKTIDLPGHGSNLIEFTSHNALSYALREFDLLKEAYSTIDVIGYSLGGVIALYIQKIRPINKLILLAPALKYLNFRAYSFTKKKSKENLSIREIRPKKSNTRYLLTFVSLVNYVSNRLDIVYPKLLIIWGRDDYLVKESSGYYIFNIAKSKYKSFIILDNINHFSIVNSKEVINYISKFVS